MLRCLSPAPVRSFPAEKWTTSRRVPNHAQREAAARLAEFYARSAEWAEPVVPVAPAAIRVAPPAAPKRSNVGSTAPGMTLSSCAETS
jgi:hypothetical protein